MTEIGFFLIHTLTVLVITRWHSSREIPPLFGSMCSSVYGAGNYLPSTQSIVYFSDQLLFKFWKPSLLGTIFLFIIVLITAIFILVWSCQNTFGYNLIEFLAKFLSNFSPWYIWVVIYILNYLTFCSAVSSFCFRSLSIKKNFYQFLPIFYQFS